MLESELKFKEVDESIIRDDYTPEEIRKMILETNEEENRVGKITKNVRDDSTDEWIMAKHGWKWTDVEQWIGTYHEFELARKLRVPFDIGQDRNFVGDASGNHVFILESNFEELDQNDPRAKKKQERMDMLRRKMTETPAEFDRQGQIVICGHVIPFTKKELIEAGLDPEQFGWKSLEQVKYEEIQQKAGETAKSIAHATMGLPKRAIDGVRNLFSREKDEKQRGE